VTFTRLIFTFTFTSHTKDRFVFPSCLLAVSRRFWRLVADLSPRRPGFHPIPVHVGCVMDEVTLGGVFLWGFGFFLAIVSPSSAPYTFTHLLATLYHPNNWHTQFPTVGPNSRQYCLYFGDSFQYNVKLISQHLRLSASFRNIPDGVSYSNLSWNRFCLAFDRLFSYNEKFHIIVSNNFFFTCVIISQRAFSCFNLWYVKRLTGGKERAITCVSGFQLTCNNYAKRTARHVARQGDKVAKLRMSRRSQTLPSIFFTLWVKQSR